MAFEVGKLRICLVWRNKIGYTVHAQLLDQLVRKGGRDIDAAHKCITSGRGALLSMELQAPHSMLAAPSRALAFRSRLARQLCAIKHDVWLDSVVLKHTNAVHRVRDEPRRGTA